MTSTLELEKSLKRKFRDRTDQGVCFGAGGRQKVEKKKKGEDLSEAEKAKDPMRKKSGRKIGNGKGR